MPLKTISFLLTALALLLTPINLLAPDKETPEIRIAVSDGLISWYPVPDADRHVVVMSWGDDGFLIEFLELSEVSIVCLLASRDVLLCDVIGKPIEIEVSALEYRETRGIINNWAISGDRLIFRLDKEGNIIPARDFHRVRVGLLRARADGSTLPIRWYTGFMLDDRFFISSTHVWVFVMGDHFWPSIDAPPNVEFSYGVTTITRNGHDYVFSDTDVADGINMPIRFMLGAKWYSFRFLAESLGYQVEFMPNDHGHELDDGEFIIRISR